MRVLITGANGLLGSKISEIYDRRGHVVYAGFTSVPPAIGKPVQMDITDKVMVREGFEDCSPDIVYHCAAATNVDACEADPQLAKEVNVEGTSYVVHEAKRVGCQVIFISTDYVFDGQQGHYREDDPPNPINVYGRTKLEAERIVLASGRPSVIARTSVIFGATPSSGKQNFALWVLENLRRGKRIQALTDRYACPTYNQNLAEMLIETAERGFAGICHLCGATRASRYEFAVAIAETFGLDKSMVVPAASSEMESRMKAKRPPDSSLDNCKSLRILRTRPMELMDALSAMKVEMEANPLMLPKEPQE